MRYLVSFVTRATVLFRKAAYAVIARFVAPFRRAFISSPRHPECNGGVPERGLSGTSSPGESIDAVPSPQAEFSGTIPFDEDTSDDGRLRALLSNSPIFADSRVSEKTRMACSLAAEIGFDLVWMDSCCIDQDSSAELSEAINSMYEWYECSTICLVFLSDVDGDDDLSAPESQFRESRWHCRGWTLQELIAPRYHIFYSREWNRLGTKMSLAPILAEVTGIDRRILNHEMSVDRVPVAQRMFWASKRYTTRVEDEAYALMGIFGVHMPTIYGEGRKAFIRLQEEILRHTYDQTIFAWGPCWRHGEVPEVPLESPGGRRGVQVQTPFMHMYGLLANSPNDFYESDGIYPLDHGTLVRQLRINADLLPYPEYIISHDIRTRLPVLPADEHQQGLPEPWRKLMYHRLAILACHDRDGALIALPLIRSANVIDYTNIVGATMEPELAVYYHMFAVPSAEMDKLVADVSVQDVRIFRRAPMLRLDTMCVTDLKPFSAMRFTLQAVEPEAWSCAALADQGFHLTTREQRDTASYDVLLTRADKGELELTIIHAVFRRHPDSRSKWYDAFQHFEVAYKSARRSHRAEGFERRECVEISRDHLGPYTKWNIFKLRCASGQTRTMRLSFKWYKVIMPRISIELTEPCDEDQLSELPGGDHGTSPKGLREYQYDELARYLQTLWYRYIPPDSSYMAVPNHFAEVLHELARRMKETGWAPELLLNAERDVNEDHPMWQQAQEEARAIMQEEAGAEGGGEGEGGGYWTGGQ